MTPEELDELAERYASGKMGPDELMEYEAISKNHPELKEIFTMNQALYQTLNSRQIAFRKKIDLIRSDLSPLANNPGKKKGLIFWISLAAVIIILLSMVIFFNSKKSPPTPEELYLAYMQRPASLSPDLSPNRSGAADSFNRKPEDSVLILADEKYMKGQFQEAIQILELASIYSATERIRFQTALLYLMAGQPREAITIFKTIRQYNQSEIYWYAALGYLQINEPENARNNLILIEQDSRWYQKSRELLGKL